MVLRKFYLTGTVIFFISVPFLFGQPLTNSLERGNPQISQFHLELKLPISEQSLASPPRWNHSGTCFSKGDFADSTKSDSNITVIKKDSVKKVNAFKMKKSPLVATLLSAVLPGAGQIYNQSYWKVPIIAGLVGYFGYEYFHYNNIYKDYRDQYAASQTPAFPEGDDNLKTLREFNRTQRDDFVWYFLIIYVINMADAFVDAHLFDFDVKEEKIISHGFGIIDRKAELNVHIRF
jgi:hypothetical protein